MKCETGDWMPGGSDMEQRQSDAEDMNRIIESKMGARERLETLAEEAAELSQAALKMIRAYKMGGAVNPTPITTNEALENLFEEVADVELAEEALGMYYLNRRRIEEIKEKKRSRWVERLKGAENNE